ncbi:MAG: hypothetical protein RMK32_08045 [Anaerolineae bacterium]|nr:hypothetical protein [Thermoflexus sp.]MDW8065568.1 hypothetical protein [Anaerolineae bacterium]
MAAVFRIYYALVPGVFHDLARLLDEEAEHWGSPSFSGWSITPT